MAEKAAELAISQKRSSRSVKSSELSGRIHVSHAQCQERSILARLTQTSGRRVNDTPESNVHATRLRRYAVRCAPNSQPSRQSERASVCLTNGT